jgi:hypothetical protein
MRANEVHVIPGPPYVINLTALPVTDDLGVLFSADGTPLGKGSGPAAGEYKLVVPGVYQFNGDDTGKTVAISYLYTDTSGTTLDLSQPTTGASPTLSAVLMGSHAGKQVLLRLRSGVLDFASLPMTLDRFSVHNLKLRALADAQDRVLTMSLQG